jgi:uncharacterized protein YbaR (Trm112 family)
MFEPYAYNPWRRISEFRDRFKGTIEKSFSIRSIKTLCNQANLDIFLIERNAYVSGTKLERLGPIHRAARIAHYRISEAMPSVFGMILLIARKGYAQAKVPDSDVEFEDLLRCPASMSRLKRVSKGYLAIDDPHRRFYPINGDIPLLLTSDCQLLSEAAFKSLLQ